MKLKRDKQGRWVKGNDNIKIGVIIGIILAVFLALYFNETVGAEEFTQNPVVVEERDNIQKLADSLAEAYRVLEEAEKEYARASSTKNRAVEAYDKAVWNLNTYTR